jgi:hypothetical protein
MVALRLIYQTLSMAATDVENSEIVSCKRLTRFARFVKWLERTSEPHHNRDRAQIEAEGILIDDKHARYTWRASRWFGPMGAWSIHWDEGRLVVTETRVRLYSWGYTLVLDIGFSEFTGRKASAALVRPRLIDLRIPRTVASGGYSRSHNSKFRIESEFSNQLYALIEHAQA